ncbi:MAG TPA: Gfo/Idh/MocA family oxidoreductase [Sedimentisphaerales bacterium]|nr:Gfo/Idh/MocA family oxidoreductase [Sedimentisphaerales bacterium]
MKRCEKKPISRRKFLANSALAGFAFHFVPSRLLGADAPSNKLNIAGIGVGGMGGGNLKECESENIVALCDVDSDYAGKTIKKYPNAKVYKDYRVMFDKQKDIDAVVIATPDHTHAVITMAAMQRGKHVYCQKPLTHTVYEARKITEAARKYKVQTQMGNQGHSSDSIRMFKEWIDDGAIGDVRQVYAWTDRPVGGDPWSDFAVMAKPQDTPPVPKSLDWDLWLGPVRYRPYHPEYHPTKWRAWLDFGTGALGDMGCHIIDPAFWALDLGAPESIEATTTHWKPEVSSQTFPRASIVRYEFPARGKKPPVKLTWFDGRLLPPIPDELEKGRKVPGSGAFIIGDKGCIMHGSHGAGGARIIPETKMQEYKRPEQTIPRIQQGHEGDWIRACKDGRPASSNFDYGGALTEMVLLGMIAIRVKDQKLQWDADNLKFTNNDAANELLHIQYRTGWHL